MATFDCSVLRRVVGRRCPQVVDQPVRADSSPASSERRTSNSDALPLGTGYTLAVAFDLERAQQRYLEHLPSVGPSGHVRRQPADSESSAPMSTDAHAR